jgi:hypothetical protein
MFEASTLFASLFWGSLGVGYFIYGKKQAAMIILTGGIALVVISYLIPSALIMSIAGTAIAAGSVWLSRRFE